MTPFSCFTRARKPVVRTTRPASERRRPPVFSRHVESGASARMRHQRSALILWALILQPATHASATNARGFNVSEATENGLPTEDISDELMQSYTGGLVQSCRSGAEELGLCEQSNVFTVACPVSCAEQSSMEQSQEHESHMLGKGGPSPPTPCCQPAECKVRTALTPAIVRPKHVTLRDNHLTRHATVTLMRVEPICNHAGVLLHMPLGSRCG